MIEKWELWIDNDLDVDLRDTIENRLDVLDIIKLAKVEREP